MVITIQTHQIRADQRHQHSGSQQIYAQDDSVEPSELFRIAREFAEHDQADDREPENAEQQQLGKVPSYFLSVHRNQSLSRLKSPRQNASICKGPGSVSRFSTMRIARP